MVKLLNRAKMSISSTGTGDISLAAAVVNFQTFAQAGALDGNVVRYGIQDGADAWEVGTAVMSNSATVMARTVNESSNGGNALNLTSSAVVFGTLSAADFSDNAAPDFLNAIPSTLELTAGAVSTIDAKALDDDGFPISYSFDAHDGTNVYSANSLPPQLSAVAINQTTGVFSLTAVSSASGAGSVNFRVRASDGVRAATKKIVANLSFLPTTGLMGLYDMKDSNSYSGSGSSWADISGNSGPNLTITTANTTYNSSGLGGVPSLTLHTKDTLGPVYYSGSHFANSASQATVCMIFASRSALSETNWVMLSNAVARSYSIGPTQNSSYDAIYSSASSGGRPVASSTSVAYVDKVVRTTATGGDFYDFFRSSANIDKYHSVVLTDGWFYNGFYLSNNSPNTGKSPFGELRALVFYNRTLTAGEVTGLHAHFAADYTSSTMAQ